MKLILSLVKYLCYGLFFASTPWLLTRWYYHQSIASVAALTPAPTAIVFGAGLSSKNTPSAVLLARIQEAVKLYHEGKVKSILLSGDGLDEFHNEPAVMRKYALKLGVPAQALILDYTGNDTYNTCLNAKDIFDIDNAILVTQRFHVSRALFICNNLGIKSIGIDLVPRNNSKRIHLYQNIREILATFAAWIEVWGNQLR